MILTEEDKKKVIEEITEKGGYLDLQNYYYGYRQDFIDAVLDDEEIALANVHGDKDSLKYLPFRPEVQPKVVIRFDDDCNLDQEFNRKSIRSFIENPTNDFKIEIRHNNDIIDPVKPYSGTHVVFPIKCVLMDLMTPGTAMNTRFVKGDGDDKDAQTEAFLLVLEELFAEVEEDEKHRYLVECRGCNNTMAFFKADVPEWFLKEHDITTKYPDCFGAPSPHEFMDDRLFARWVVNSFYMNYCRWDRVELRCNPVYREDTRKNWMTNLDMGLD